MPGKGAVRLQVRQQALVSKIAQKKAPLKKRGSHEKNGKIAFGQ
jgi:hypothetical protein